MASSPPEQPPREQSTDSTEAAKAPKPKLGRRRWWITALLLQRCPICREAKIFKGLVTMNKVCPLCGLVFEPEPGYFLASMYVSYGMAVAIMAPVFFLLLWLLPGWSGEAVAFLSVIPYIPLIPLVFRYSRVI